MILTQKKLKRLIREAVRAELTRKANQDSLQHRWTISGPNSTESVARNIKFP